MALCIARPAETLLSRVRVPPPAPWPDGGPESLRSTHRRLALYEIPPPNCRRVRGTFDSKPTLKTRDVSV
ncbi:hypothetical protein PoB_004256400 [Plakobranchus ocellatus]|uniref:Uncharacterized protein n=1 Tax=Plakobranchus ocellatus TaxID=259542 RepID=A0AAV4BBF2_9GAST|nr:hypothetical protein PoB_004256400 [Plakobranchus ocellatus]